MATVCLQCGDRGFDVALIYCEVCKSYAIHRYCLETLPKTFDEDVDWFCDDCQSKSGKPDTNKESCSPLYEVDDLPDLKIPESVQCTKNSKEYIHLERLGKKKNKKRKRKRKKREKNELKPQREKDEEGEQLGDKGTERLGTKKNKKKRKKNKLKDQREKYEEGGQLGEKGTVFTSGAKVEKTKDVPLIQVCETRCSGNYNEVTFHYRESARRACESPSPVIDGRRAYCNLASLGRPRPPLPYGQLRPVTPLIGSVQAPRGSYVRSPVYHHSSPYDYQPGYAYPPYEYPTYEPNFVYPQGAYNSYMAQHYRQRYRAPSTYSSDFCSFGWSGHRPPGNHGYP
ncbi:uncharacterized protein LOC115664841, partial [Syzygium oleosum]|uniref:uncharacterized protein LOC115664841 n=1 Tax=Syzygium oleosum TaxID=219896 RepID=UPI0024BB73C8